MNGREGKIILKRYGIHQILQQKDGIHQIQILPRDGIHQILLETDGINQIL